MSFYTTQEFREIFDVVEQIGDARISFCQESATDELRTLIGDAATNDALVATPTDANRAGTVRRAHAFLTAGELVVNTGARMRPFGLAKIEKDLDSNVAISTQTEYQSQKDVQMLADRLHAKAEKILAPYLLTISGDEETTFAPEFETGVLTTEAAADAARWRTCADNC